MKLDRSPLRAFIASIAIGAIGALFVSSAEAGTPPCPYNVNFSHYGAACSASGAQVPTLNEAFDGSNGCHVAMKYVVPPFCCNVGLTGQLLVLGTQPVSIPAPGGCTLLVSPNVIAALPPAMGTTVVEGDLPPSPALIGANLYMQGIVGWFSTFSFTVSHDFTDGLQLSIVP